jgi:ATP-dependent protease ClpP protease subunit
MATTQAPPPQTVHPAPQIVYVPFSAEINANTSESLIAVMANCANHKEVYLMLSTSGGIVMNGLNLYNVMRATPFKLITHNVGNVDSIGNALFLTGVERYACPHSTFMFHGVGLNTQPKTRLEEKSTRETLNSILAEQYKAPKGLGQ